MAGHRPATCVRSARETARADTRTRVDPLARGAAVGIGLVCLAALALLASCGPRVARSPTSSFQTYDGGRRPATAATARRLGDHVGGVKCRPGSSSAAVRAVLASLPHTNPRTPTRRPRPPAPQAPRWILAEGRLQVASVSGLNARPNRTRAGRARFELSIFPSHVRGSRASKRPRPRAAAYSYAKTDLTVA